MTVFQTIAKQLLRIDDRLTRLETVEKLYTPAWDDFIVAPSAGKLPTSGAPSWVDYKSSQVLEFSASATNTFFFSAQMPHQYKTGSAIEFHIHLAYQNANAGNSVWQITYSWANIGGTFPAATTSATAVIASPAETDHHQLAELLSTIDGTGKTLSSILLCSLARLGGDGSDTYASTIYLVGVDFHIQRDSLGSRQETVK